MTGYCSHALYTMLLLSFQTFLTRCQSITTLCIQCALRPIDINFADEEGYTALHYACWRGHQKIVEKLLEAGADVTARYVKLVMMEQF